jgi:AraC-like DNA-binding protein
LTSSANIFVSHIEDVLSFTERYYYRQFITREKVHHQVLVRLEKMLAHQFNNINFTAKCLLTVHSISHELNLPKIYLSRLLKTLTGQSSQQLLHDKLIDNSKERLSATDPVVWEIAYS